MLYLFFSIFKFIQTSNILDDEMIKNNIKKQIVSIVEQKIYKNDFITFEDAAKEMHAYVVRETNDLIKINICHVLSSCINDYFFYVVDEYSLTDQNLFTIFLFFKSFGVDKIYLNTSIYDYFAFSCESECEALCNLLNQLSFKSKGPYFFYVDYFNDFEHFHSNKRCNNSNCQHSAKYHQDYKFFDLRLSIDHKTGFMFYINLDDFDFSLLYKKKIELQFKEDWQTIYDFLNNFNLNQSYNFFDIPLGLFKSFYTSESSKKIPSMSFLPSFFEIYGKKVVFDQKFVYEIESNSLNGFKINIEIYKNLQKLVNFIPSINFVDASYIVFTIFSLSDKQIYSLLMRRLLNSKLSAKKILFLELLSYLKIIKRSDINWVLAYNTDMTQSLICDIFNTFFVDKIVKSIVGVKFKNRTGVYYIYVYIILYYELEDYIHECELNEELSCKLLKDFREILKVKEFKKFLNSYQTTAFKIAALFFELMTKLKFLDNSEQNLLNEFYHFTRVVINKIQNNAIVLDNFLQNKVY